MALSPEQAARLSAQERNAKLREIDQELGSLYNSLRIARAKQAFEGTGQYQERRVQSILDEIDRQERAHARRMAVLKRDLKNVQDEIGNLPSMIDNHTKKIHELEQDRKLLRSGRLLAQLAKIQRELAEL